MQRTLAVLVVALLAVTAGCSGFNQNAPANNAGPAAQSASNTQTVAVGASGQVQTAPDRAIIQVAVTARGDSVQAVRQQMAENASRMRTALNNGGIDDDQIVSSRFDVGRNYEARERPEAPKYRGEHEFVITLNETDRAGEVVVTAIENGATQVDQVQFTISPETRRDLRQQALADAVDNGHQKAQVLASGTDLSLGEVKTVRTTDVSVEPFQQREVALAAAGDGGGGGAPTSFEGGKVTVTAHVTIVYNATSTTN